MILIAIFYLGGMFYGVNRIITGYCRSDHGYKRNLQMLYGYVILGLLFYSYNSYLTSV